MGILAWQGFLAGIFTFVGGEFIRRRRLPTVGALGEVAPMLRLLTGLEPLQAYLKIEWRCVIRFGMIPA